MIKENREKFKGISHEEAEKIERNDKEEYIGNEYSKMQK